MVANATVPDVVGQSEGEATTKIADAKLTANPIPVESDETKGVVVSQDPQKGTTVKEGSPVTIGISSGPTLPPVPNVIGQDEKTAQTTLKSAGFGDVTTTPGVASDNSGRQGNRPIVHGRHTRIQRPRL